MYGFEIASDDIFCILSGNKAAVSRKYAEENGLDCNLNWPVADHAFSKLTPDELQAISDAANYTGDIDAASDRADKKIIEILQDKGIFLANDDSGEPIRFRNHYRCDDCNEEWDDEWSATCDDKCPSCNAPIQPHKSEDL